jgi:hypothetical protein
MAQEVINFQSGKYVWEEIPGKGKSLVPYKEPVNPLAKLRVGSVVRDPFNEHWTICRDYNSGLHGTIITSSEGKINNYAESRYNLGFKFKTLADLVQEIEEYFPKSVIVRE